MKSVQTPSTVVVPAGRICPRCGAPLGGFGPEGLCGACMFDVALLADEPAAELDLLATGPRRFGDYELIEEIARGGMGVIFKARQLSLNRLVAVKMILRGEFASVADLARFRSEAETAARLQHPNIVAIHEVGEREGQPYFTMDYVEGQNLAQLIGNTPLPASRAAKYLKTVTEAVQHAHEQGILHRDLKPSNVLIDVNDQPRVTDFGLAKRLDAQLSPNDPQLTQTGQVLGSPNFMPPEQAAGKNDTVGPASDVYSLGAILYHALTGRPPFVAESVTATLRLVAESEAVSPRLLVPTVPRDLETICLMCLQKEPQRRYATAQELADDLNHFLRDEPIHAQPATPIEKGWRWCRRKPALASAILLVLVLCLVVGIGSPIAAFRINRERLRAEQHAGKEEQQRLRAEENADKAEKAAKLEAAQRTRAETLAEESRWNLYAARIKVAERALEEADIPRALQLLDSLRPQSGQEDLRSFDWYYLWQRCHSEIMSLPGSAGLGRNVAFSPDGRWLATVDSNGRIHLWNATNGVERAQMSGHTGRVNQVAFAPRGETLASAGADGTVRIWELATGKAVRILQISTNSLATLAFSPDGRQLFAGEGSRTPASTTPSGRYTPQAASGQVAVWNTDTYQLERSIVAHSNGVLSLALSPDGNTLATSGLDRRVKLFDCVTGRELRSRTNANSLAPVFDLAFLRNGMELAFVSWAPHLESGEIVVLDAAGLEEKRRFSGPAGKVLCLAISPDGSKLASAGADRVTRLWDIDSGTELTAYYGHNAEIMSVAFSPDGKSLATGASDAIRLWDVENNPVRQNILTENCFSVAFSPDGKWIACAGRQVEVREAGTGKLVRTLTGYTNADMRVAFAPDGSVLAATGFDCSVHFWDTQTWRHWAPSAADSDSTKEHDGLNEADTRFAFSPDSRTLAMAGDDRVVRFWDVKTGALLHSFNHPNRMTSAAFTPDGQALITGEWGLLSFWDLATRRIKNSIPEAVFSVRLSKDDRWLATAVGATANVRNRSTLKIHAKLSGHKEVVWCVAFSHDSRLVATCSWDGTVRLWHVLSGQELLNVPSHAGVVWNVAFAPGDRALAFGCGSSAKGLGKVVILRAASDMKTETTRFRPRVLFPPPAQFRASVPPRPRDCPTNLLDLSAYYNAGLSNYWMSAGLPGNDLSPVPSRIHAFNGVAFDVRGVVQLASANSRLEYQYPMEVVISVAQQTPAVHFLQSACWSTDPGAAAGEYIIHYADATEARVPVIYGEHLVDWSGNPTAPERLSETTTTAWEGANSVSRSAGRTIRLYDFRWPNPHPEKKIQSIGFKSAMTECAPFLLAITTEPSSTTSGTDLTFGALPSIPSADLLGIKAGTFARGGEWKQAAIRLTKAIEFEPSNHLYYHWLAPLLVASGDAANYRKLCQRILAQFDSTQSRTASERMAKACLILPNAEMDFDFINRMIVVATRGAVGNYSQFAAALAAYRQENFSDALERLEQVVPKPDQDPNLDVQIWMVRAMAHHGLNQTNQAGAALAKSLEIARTKLPKLNEGDLGGYWNDWIISQALLREGRTLIEGKAASETDAFKAKK